MNSTFKTVVLWVVLLLVGVALWRMIQGGGASAKDQELTYTNFIAKVN